MELKTQANIGDKFWVMGHPSNDAVQASVINITIRVSESCIEYLYHLYLNDSKGFADTWVDPSHLYRTKEELLNGEYWNT